MNSDRQEKRAKWKVIQHYTSPLFHYSQQAEQKNTPTCSNSTNKRHLFLEEQKINKGDWVDVFHLHITMETLYNSLFLSINPKNISESQKYISNNNKIYWRVL